MRRHPSREPPLHADPTRRTTVLSPKAHELSAYVGSTAWVVLEEMMQRSTGEDDHVVAQVSIRSLASSLGLAKDTVARVVRRLRDLSVIQAAQRRSDSGVFQTGSYRLDVPTVCLTVDISTTTHHRRPHPTPHRRTTNTATTTDTANTTDTGQLSLTFNSPRGSAAPTSSLDETAANSSLKPRAVLRPEQRRVESASLSTPRRSTVTSAGLWSRPWLQSPRVHLELSPSPLTGCTRSSSAEWLVRSNELESTSYG